MEIYDIVYLGEVYGYTKPIKRRKNSDVYASA